MLDLPKYGSENDIIIDVGEGGKKTKWILLSQISKNILSHFFRNVKSKITIKCLFVNNLYL